MWDLHPDYPGSLEIKLWTKLWLQWNKASILFQKYLKKSNDSR